MSGEVLERHLAYWRQQLAGMIGVLELPTDRPRPARRTFRCSRYAFGLTPSLSAAVCALSRQQGATLFMTLLAAYQTLLYRYTGNDDICVGSPIANRNRAEIEGLIGCFVNMLALRTRMDGNPSFRELLGRVREVTLGAYAHQDLPFEQVVEAVHPERHLSHAPLAQVTFTFQNAPRQTLEISDISIRPIEIDSGTVEFDMSLLASGDAHGIGGLMIYNSDLFVEATVRKMMAHFQEILEQVVADPEIPLLRIRLLTGVDEHAPESDLPYLITDEADEFVFARSES